MGLLFTVTGTPQVHYCVDCADNVDEVSEAIHEAHDEERFEIGEVVHDEVCQHCGRSISGVPIVTGEYVSATSVTFQVKVILTMYQRSAVLAEILTEEFIDKADMTEVMESIDTAIKEQMERRQITQGRVVVKTPTYEASSAKLVPKNMPELSQDTP